MKEEIVMEKITEKEATYLNMIIDTLIEAEEMASERQKRPEGVENCIDEADEVVDKKFDGINEKTFVRSLYN